MDIAYKGKIAEIFGNYVKHPDDREAGRKFDKTFNRELREPANRLHSRFKSAQSAMTYNVLYRENQNGIEKKSGCKEKDRLVLKVRITKAWRKFFYAYAHDSNKLYQVKEWDEKGNLDDITEIMVFDVNKHNYK
ncbi:MAG: hypothetical protein KBT28_10565 [Bacteroidales bacterium]|nr:hypothetical protein [Candidatus Colimorpha merdihippi]